MKLLFTEGIGASQTTINAQDEKIPVYETKTAAETDLVNLEVGQIIATKDEGSELSNPVDVVQDGNMHAVTSNAVADSINELQPVNSVLSGNMKSVTSNAVADSINELQPVNVVEGGNMKSVTSNAVAASINELQPVNSVLSGNMKSVTSNAVAASINELQPVNVVEGGNMSAVTSNAVFDYLDNINNDIEVIRPTPNMTSNITITRFGHVANMNGSVYIESSGILARDIPLPIALKDGGEFIIIHDGSPNTKLYLQKENNGSTSASMYAANISPNTTLYFSVFYFV